MDPDCNPSTTQENQISSTQILDSDDTLSIRTANADDGPAADDEENASVISGVDVDQIYQVLGRDILKSSLLEDVDLYLECEDDEFYEMPIKTSKPAPTNESSVNEEAQPDVTFKISFPCNTDPVPSRYQCEICRKTFTRPTLVLDHKSRTHGIEKLFPCPECDYKGNLYRHLMKHVRRMHPSFGKDKDKDERGMAHTSHDADESPNQPHVQSEKENVTLPDSVTIISEKEPQKQNADLCRADTVVESQTNDTICQKGASPGCSKSDGCTNISVSDNVPAIEGPRQACVDTIASTSSKMEDENQNMTTTSTSYYPVNAQDDGAPIHTQNITPCQQPDMADSEQASEVTGSPNEMEQDVNSSVSELPTKDVPVVNTNSEATSSKTDAGDIDRPEIKIAETLLQIGTLVVNSSTPKIEATPKGSQRNKKGKRKVDNDLNVQDVSGKKKKKTDDAKKFKTKHSLKNIATGKRKYNRSSLSLKKQLKRKSSQNVKRRRTKASEPNAAKAYDCPFEGCGKSYHSNHSLQGHTIKSHSDKFKCTWEGCEKRFGSSFNLDSHYKTHTGEKPMVCQHCDYTCIQKSALDMHMMCKHLAILQKEYQQKVDESNTGAKKRKKTLPKRRGFKQSSKTERTKSSTNKPGQPRRPKRPRPEPDASNRYPCDHPGCTVTLKQWTTLQEHKATVHAPKLFKCEYEGCSKAYSLKRYLIINQVQHSDINRCTWEGCKRKFRDSYNLKLHMKTHTGEKSLSCGLCDYSCIQRNSMNWHMKSKHNPEGSEKPTTKQKSKKANKDVPITQSEAPFDEAVASTNFGYSYQQGHLQGQSNLSQLNDHHTGDLSTNVNQGGNVQVQGQDITGFQTSVPQSFNMDLVSQAAPAVGNIINQAWQWIQNQHGMSDTNYQALAFGQQGVLDRVPPHLQDLSQQFAVRSQPTAPMGNPLPVPTGSLQTAGGTNQPAITVGPQHSVFLGNQNEMAVGTHGTGQLGMPVVSQHGITVEPQQGMPTGHQQGQTVCGNDTAVTHTTNTLAPFQNKQGVSSQDLPQLQSVAYNPTYDTNHLSGLTQQSVNPVASIAENTQTMISLGNMQAAAGTMNTVVTPGDTQTMAVVGDVQGEADVPAKSPTSVLWPKARLATPRRVSVSKKPNTVVPCLEKPSPSKEGTVDAGVSSSASGPKTLSPADVAKLRYYCDHADCNAALRTEKSLRNHKASVHGPKLYKCDEPGCERSYALSRQLKVHKGQHTVKHSCTWKGCVKTFRSKSNLRLHLKTHTGQKSQKCSHCDYTCVQRTSIRWHMIRKHPEVVLSADYKEPEPPVKPDPTKVVIEVKQNPCVRFICDHPNCGKILKSKEGLRDHKKTVHSPRTFRCPVQGCLKAYALQRYLTVHMRQHTATHPCPWEGCTKAFRDSHNLRTHYKIHTGEKDLKCEHCEYTCIQRNSMNWHMRSKHPEEQRRADEEKQAVMSVISSAVVVSSSRPPQSEEPPPAPPAACTVETWKLNAGLENAHSETHAQETT